MENVTEYAARAVDVAREDKAKNAFLKTHGVYAIWDGKVEAYSPPFIQKTAGQAIRFLTDLVNGQSSDVSKYPQDYDLFQVGEWDENKGQVKPLAANVHLVKALELRGQTE